MGHLLGFSLTLFFYFVHFFLSSFNNGSLSYIPDKKASKYIYSIKATDYFLKIFRSD